jgi:alpha-methylacyl-CoA racemase
VVGLLTSVTAELILPGRNPAGIGVALLVGAVGLPPGALRRGTDEGRVLMADLAGAEQAVSTALSLLFARERGQGAGYEQVALSEAARSFAEPLRQGLMASGGALGGGFPGYGLYRAREGHVALAALEGHFWKRLLRELGVKGDRQHLERAFETRTAERWEEWAAERDLPLAAVRSAEYGGRDKEDEIVSAS